MCFVRHAGRVSQRVSVSRALMDTSLVAPVIDKQLRFDIVQARRIHTVSNCPNNIRIFEKRSDKRETDSL